MKFTGYKDIVIKVYKLYKIYGFYLFIRKYMSCFMIMFKFPFNKYLKFRFYENNITKLFDM